MGLAFVPLVVPISAAPAMTLNAGSSGSSASFLMALLEPPSLAVLYLGRPTL